MSTLIHQRVEAARRGENPFVVCCMPSGWLVMHDRPVLDGYCLLLPDPVVPSLNEMDPGERLVFLDDMALAGDALLRVTGAFRINYEILGNSDPALHAHIIPRYMTEEEQLRKGPVWFYSFEKARSFDPQRDGPLMERLAAEVQRLVAEFKRE